MVPERLQCGGPRRCGRALGTILGERERQAAKVAVENVGGVKAVKDHLVWTEPRAGWYSPVDRPIPTGRCQAQTRWGGSGRYALFVGRHLRFPFVSERPIADGINPMSLQTAKWQ
jgi:hypothetical protein